MSQNEGNVVVGESDHTFDYQLLSRLKQDCEYYLGNGCRHPKHLWAENEAAQIAKMKELYAALPAKPEWLSMDDIEKYEASMVVVESDKQLDDGGSSLEM